MKVFLAAQTMNQSMATAMKFCSQDLRLPEFQGSKPKQNEIIWIDGCSKVVTIKNCLTSIRLKSNKLIYETNKSTGFLGFFLGLGMLKDLYKDYISTNYLSYLLTYKMSHDYLELFFVQCVPGVETIIIRYQDNPSLDINKYSTYLLSSICNLPHTRKDGDVEYPIDMFDFEDDDINDSYDSYWSLYQTFCNNEKFQYSKKELSAT